MAMGKQLCKSQNNLNKFIDLKWLSLYTNQLSLLNMSQLLDTLKDFFSGCVSGWVQVLVMQPFQIVKVRLINQSLHNPEYNGIADCFRKIYKEEGGSAFYKGTLSPLVGIGAQVSLQFGSNQLIKKLLFKINDEFLLDDDDDVQKLPMSLVLASGLLTGIPSSLSVTPVDHTRILMQVQKGNEHKYQGSIDAGIKIYKKYGIRGLYLGFYPTLLRQTMAMATYFGIYQIVWRQCDKYEPEQKFSTQQKMLISFFGGGLAGSGSWLFTYPIDYIKTLIQSQNLEARKYKDSMDCVRTKYKEQGIRTFFKGLGVTMIRSFPVNGCGFMAFQFMMRRLGRRGNEKGGHE